MTLFSSNFVLISICKFFKTSNCTCTWKIRSPYLHPIAWKIILLPVHNLHESKSRQNFSSVLFAICTCATTLHSCFNFAPLLKLCTHVTNLHLCYMKNALFFSQSGMHNFFMYVISRITALLFNLSTCFLFIYRMQTGIQLTCTGLWKK